MSDFRALTSAQSKAFWREKQNWFWLMIFPLMFMVIFGLLFRDAGVPQSKIAVIGDVVLIEQMPPQAKQQFDELFSTKRYDDPASAIDAVRKGDMDGAIMQDGNVLHLHYSQADQVTAATVQGAFQSFINGANQAISQTPPTFRLTAQPVEDASLQPIQFIAPGLLGWAVAMTGMFNTSIPLVQWRTTKLLRRLRLSPARASALVASQTAVCLTVALLQMAVFLTVGVVFFGLKLSGWWWFSIPLVLVGTLCFMGLGMIAGAVSRTVEAASGLSNVVILPMAFLSGSFIPLDQAPSWLRTVSQFLPLGHLNEGMLDLMVRDQGPSSIAVPIAVLLAFAAAFWLVAARLFRWDD